MVVLIVASKQTIKMKICQILTLRLQSSNINTILFDENIIKDITLLFTTFLSVENELLKMNKNARIFFAH